jgi:hypothetical protein
MSRDEVVASICRLPSESKSRNVSIFDLLRQSGYSESTCISEQEIEAYLRQYPDLTEPWIRYSEDQRCSTGWWITEPLNPEVLKSDWFKNNIDVVRNNYLGDHAEGKWTVGDHPITVKRTFDDEFKAFAFFVRQKVRELAEIAGRSR